MAVTDVNLDGARDIADEVDGAAFELDVRSTDSVSAAVEGAERELGEAMPGIEIGTLQENGGLLQNRGW